MNGMRIGVCCALIGWMAADAQAQLGTYGSPDPISWGQPAPRDGYGPNMASPASYVTPASGSGVVPASTSESTAVSQMLTEPGGVPAASGGTGAAMMPPGGCMQNAGNCDVCGDCCGCGCCCPWYATVYGLWMTRSAPDKVFTSAQAAAQVNQGSFNDLDWTWGVQGTIGYRFGCCCDWALEATYWGLCESNTDGGPGIRGPYVTPMTFGLVDILGTTGGGGTNGDQTANNYTDGSPNHHIWREWDAQNVEFNLVRNVCGGQCSCACIDFLMGVRWLRFQDGYEFGAQRQADGSAYAGDWLYLNNHITDDMVGFQLGFNASYRFGQCWNVFVTPKFGVYGNHMTMDYNLYAVSSATGQQYQASSQTYANPNYPVHATADGFSFITQVDLGLDWQVTDHVSTQFGYRVVAITGVGLADEQIPFFGNDTQAIADIDHNASLILHGAFAGLTFSW